MLTTLLAATLLSLQGASAAAETTPAAADASATETVAKAEPVKAEKITDRNHPDYMRCRRETIIGSRAKKRKICMTNREWELAIREGNRGTRGIVDRAQSGMNESN